MRKKTKLLLQIADTPEVVWQKCRMDIVGPLTRTSEGNKYLLTFQDELSKYTMAVPIEREDAMAVAIVLKSKLF